MRSAPAYRIEITRSTIIGTAGTLSPASILVCGLIMFGIAFAFINLNRSMANAGALHHRYSRLHPRWNTPHIAIFFIWIVGLALLFVSSYLPTINVILQDSITAIGFQICFYLGLTGLACAWYYCGELTTGLWRAISHVI